MEKFCKLVSGCSGVWYATNIEIVDYLNALDRLGFSAKSSSVYNPSGIDMWIKVDDRIVEVKKGETYFLNV